MLGIKQNTSPLSGDNAEKIRRAAIRVALEKPNKEEITFIERQREIKHKYKVVWK